MAITTTYAWQTRSSGDANFITADPDAASLENDGYATVGTHDGHVDEASFDSSGTGTGSVFTLTGTKAAAAGLNDGNVVVVSQDADSILYSIVSPTGSVVLASTDINDTASTNADVAALAGGGFVVVSQDNFGSENDIDLRVYSAAGQLQVGITLDSSTADDVEPSVIGLDNGNIAVAWTRNVGGETEVWTAVYTPMGVAIKAPSLFDTFGSVNKSVSVAATNTGFAVAYQDNGWGTGNTDISLVTFDMAGNYLSLINVSSPMVTNDGSHDAAPAVTRLSNGMLAVSWNDNSWADTDIEIALVEATGVSVLAMQVLSQGQSILDDMEDSAIAAFGLARTILVAENVTDGNVDYETLSAVRKIISDNAADTITALNDMDHELVGNGGADVLKGGLGFDTLNGGSENDKLDGGGGNDLLLGEAGNDNLNGGVGADAMYGGVGNDTYTVDNADDTIGEAASEGTDVVNASVSYTLAANVEKLTLTGSAGLSGAGNNLNNVITGNGGANSLYGLEGNDTLNGKGGGDYMEGGLGNDTYFVDNAGDQTVESSGAGSGTDTVKATVTHTLAANIENLTLTGNANLNGAGNGENNKITGNNGNNTLSGGIGNDTLLGGKGNDTLLGGDQNDLLTGGAGLDTLTGGSGNDKFIFLTTADSGGAFVDIITDFTQGQDKIDLSKIDANILGAAAGNQAFSFIGTAAFSGGGAAGAGQLRYQKIGSETHIMGDVNGDGTADFLIKLDDLVNLASGDFVL